MSINNVKPTKSGDSNGNYTELLIDSSANQAIDSNSFDSSRPNSCKSCLAACFGCGCCNNNSSNYKKSCTPCNPCKPSFKCCCLWFILLLIISLIIFIIILFNSIIPQVAQETTDHSTMTVISMHLSNITTNSVLMNVSIELSNCGQFDAKIDSAMASSYFVDSDSIISYIGDVQIPSISVKANTPAIVDMVAPLSISNITNFKMFAKSILSGQNAKLLLKSSPQITVDLGSMKTSTDVTLNKELELKGINIEHGEASNITVISAEGSNLLYGSSQMSLFASSFQLFSFKIDDTVRFDLYDSDNVYIGYGMMKSLEMIPGYNEFNNLETYVDRTDENSDNIATFLSNFMMGINQKLTVFGPIPVSNDKIKVTDYCLNMSVTGIGSDAGDLIMGGMINSDSQVGWTVKNGSDSIDIQGAYSAVKNPLNVNITVIKTQSDIFLQEPLKYKYRMSYIGFDVLKGECNTTTQFTHIHTGYGMYQNNPSKTYVDISANDISSFFAIAKPQTGQYDYNPSKSECSIFDGLLTQPYPCCFLFETLAAICRDNPTLGDSNENYYNELEKDFVSTRVESNMTLLIDEKFEVILSYKQDFLPLYFGKDVYEGYSEDLYFTCDNIEIK